MKKTKFLLLSVMFGVLLFGVGAVFAVNQPIEVTVGQDVTVLISPSTLDFGSLAAGTLNAPGSNITFDATGSNVNVSVSVSNVTGVPFQVGLKFNGLAPVGQMAALPCDSTSGICVYTPVSWITSLSVPIGTPAGLRSGVVTYTVSGPSP